VRESSFATTVDLDIKKSQSFDADSVPEVYRAALNLIDKFGWKSIGKPNTWSPLHWAAKENRADICIWLLSKGADARQLDENNRTALFYAQQQNSVDAIKVLSFV